MNLLEKYERFFSMAKVPFVSKHKDGNIWIRTSGFWLLIAEERPSDQVIDKCRIANAGGSNIVILYGQPGKNPCLIPHPDGDFNAFVLSWPDAGKFIISRPEKSFVRYENRTIETALMNHICRNDLPGIKCPYCGSVNNFLVFPALSYIRINCGNYRCGKFISRLSLSELNKMTA